MKLSLCMIVKNEQDVLARCLKSIKNIVDEIVIVDTGSTDNTVNIAKKYTNNVFYFDWCDDFSKARNFAFSKATCDYIIWLDADDVVPAATQKALVKLKSQISADVYMLRYDIAFCGKKPIFTYFRERIIKNCKSAVWEGCVHECICPFGKVEYINKPILHKKIKQESSNRNLKIYEKIQKQRDLNVREQYYYARELYQHNKIKKTLTTLKKLVKNNNLWIENKIDALIIMSDCYVKLKNDFQAINYLLNTLNLDLPRANVCCKIADLFYKNNKIEQAIYWYLLATKCKDVSKKGGFVEKLYYNYYPYLQLCVCYYNCGNLQKAIYYNNKAEKFNKNSIEVKNNKLFFYNLINNNLN